MATVTSDRDLLARAGAAEYLTIPEHSLDRLRYLGRGPAYIKIGKRVRYRREDLDAYLAANRVEPEAS